jgi:hypothetical protein
VVVQATPGSALTGHGKDAAVVYRATEDVVQRVMQLLDQLAHRTIDKARLLQYLSARAGIDWGVLELVETRNETSDDGGQFTLIVRDQPAGAALEIVRPDFLAGALEAMVLDEYKRLATAVPLSMMAEPLFDALFGRSYCSNCRWRGPGHEQVHRECRFAGRPINFEPM